MDNEIMEADSQLSLEQLKEENELKTKWLSLIAHDFKGLFSNINVLLSMLENKSISQDIFMSMIPEIKQITDKNIKTLDSTFAWVNAQSKSFSPHIEDVEIYEVFLELKDFFSKNILLKELSVEYIGDHKQSLCTDRFLFTFILKHIVENAIKYSNKNGTIEVVANPDSSKNKVQITIKDCGVGMKKDIVSKIGTLKGSPYTGTMQEKGAGLSMVIVKDFVNKLCGQMSIDSINEEGTSMKLTFPLKPHD